MWAGLKYLTLFIVLLTMGIMLFTHGAVAHISTLVDGGSLRLGHGLSKLQRASVEMENENDDEDEDEEESLVLGPYTGARQIRRSPMIPNGSDELHNLKELNMANILKQIQSTEDNTGAFGPSPFLKQEDVHPPTYTPFVGAGVLSDMPSFFKHLEENLIALREKGLKDSGTDKESLNPTKHLNSKGSGKIGSWRPLASGFPNDPRVISFFKKYTQRSGGPQKSLRRYIPSWGYTSLGLGK